MSKTSNDRLDQALESIDTGKRESMRRLVVGAAFVAPVVASFAIEGMMVMPALASNVTTSASNFT